MLSQDKNFVLDGHVGTVFFCSNKILFDLLLLSKWLKKVFSRFVFQIIDLLLIFQKLLT